MNEPIKSASATSSATLYSGAGRLRAIYVRAAGTAGTAIFKDGGSGGTTICTINTPAAIGPVELIIPGGGLPFGTDLYCALTTADAVTAFYAEDRTA